MCRSDFFHRLKSYFYTEDIDGAFVVNDKFGAFVGGYARGRAQRAISSQWGWPNAWLEPLWTIDTRANVASVTKVITALMVVRMSELGWVNIDESISHALPPFMNFTEYLEEGNSDITYRHLLQHRTGWRNACEFFKHYLHKVGEFENFFNNPKSLVGPEPACSGGHYSTLDALSGGGMPPGYSNANYTLLRILIPLLTFPSVAARQEFWQQFDPLSPGEKLDWYNYWTAWAFQKLSWVVQAAAGLGEVVLTRDVTSEAAGYGLCHPNGVISAGAFATTGASGMRYSARELGQVLSALRQGKILGPAGMSLMFDPSFGDPIGGRVGWMWQGSGAWGHGGDGAGLNHLILFGGKASAIVLTNKIGAQIVQGHDYRSNVLWDDILDIYSYSCVGDY